MHICFLCNEYPPGRHGGVGSFTQTLGRGLVGRGHRVTAVGVYRGENERVENDEGVRVVRLPHSSIRRTGFVVNGLRLRQSLARIHKESAIDVLDGPELSLSTVSKEFPVARVIRMHGGHHFFAVTLGRKPRPWRSWLERRSFGNANHLCAVSSFVAETTRDLLHLNGRPIEILPNPVDVTFFCPHPEIQEEDGLILFIGTVCEKKGIRQLIQAMPQIVKAVPNAKLQVVGRDWFDPQTGKSFTKYLRSFIPPHLKEIVFFTGAVENRFLPEVISRSSVCVYPSHMEAMPVAWLEGMAMGKAVVASETGPGPEVIEGGVSGLLCNPRDPASIAEKVITLLQNADLRRQLGDQARSRVSSMFSTHVLIERNESFYRRCVGANNNA
jgi:glycosyltransferase involved in cell wall biosynthesis